MRLSQCITRAAQVAPQRTATVFGERSRSWEALADRVARLASALKELGVAPGDRVAFLGRNLEWFFAVGWAGAVVVPVSVRLAPPEVRHVLDDSGASLLFADDELAGLFYTGGTTGRAKAVMLSHDNLVANAFHMVPARSGDPTASICTRPRCFISRARVAGERTKLTVGVVPIADVAPIQLGIDKGFFADEGLDVELHTGHGGAEIVPQVLSGDVEVGFSSTPTLFSAATEGLPIEIVASALGSPPRKRGRGENAEGALMVRSESPIRGYGELAGKTVAVNALGNVARLEVPFPDMLAALDAGRVDAAFLATPFKTIAEQSGKYAAAHHISLRLLHKLFEEQGTSPGRWIRERRLERCRRDLLDPACGDLPASAIAWGWGFASPAHFSRVFRAAYGHPPGEYRRLRRC